MKQENLKLTSCVMVLGSRFKRTAVPLGLMSAAASVSYPAQAVAVVKVIRSLNANQEHHPLSEQLVNYHCLFLPR